MQIYFYLLAQFTRTQTHTQSILPPIGEIWQPSKRKEKNVSNFNQETQQTHSFLNKASQTPPMDKTAFLSTLWRRLKQQTAGAVRLATFSSRSFSHACFSLYVNWAQHLRAMPRGANHLQWPSKRRQDDNQHKTNAKAFHRTSVGIPHWHQLVM